MDQRALHCVPIFCLLIAVAVASRPRSRQIESTDIETGVGLLQPTAAQAAGSSAEETTLPAAPSATNCQVNSTTSSSPVEGAINRGHPPRTLGERERVEPAANEQADEHDRPDDDGEGVENDEEGGGREEEEDYEGEDEGEAEDEYEDELKAVAESHEAMSRDDTRNSNASTATQASAASAPAASLTIAEGAGPAAPNNFDSREVITVNDSDEDVASNEAITDEIVDKYDQEVAELIKYRKEQKQRVSGSRTKTKRVPTVKKELSTQREIQLGSNETQVPKSLVPAEDTLNRLNEDTEANRRRNNPRNGSIKSENAGYSGRIGGGEIPGDNRYSDLESESPKKLDKRHRRDREDVLEEEEELVNSMKKMAQEMNILQKLLYGGRIPDYEAIDSYPRRLRYNQLSPASRNFLRRQEEDYPNDFGGAQADSFARSQEYELPARDLPLSRSWPDISYKYSPSWSMEERPLMPFASEKWPWRQPQPEAKYWPQRGKFLPLDKGYWSPLINEDPEDLPDKMQQQRLHHSWDRNRSSWPLDNNLKVYAPWDDSEGSLKPYDPNQSSLTPWQKSSNHTDSRASKHEPQQKIVLPQITMKTWNSLTSDPATWPHKLPGAKPWPKDENGKSYNPNADLVKKLGLDKQENVSWPKDESEKSNSEKKSKEDKNRMFSSKEASKEEDLFRLDSFDYNKPDSERSNFSDYKAKTEDSPKSWTILGETKSGKDWTKSESMQNDDAWRRKHEEKPTWSNEPPATLPKIQSVGAWVMSADQSTWKPYQMKPIDSPDEASSRRWSKMKDKWASKGSWAEKVNDSWMDRSEQNSWPEKHVAELWKPKSGSWFAKTSKNKEGEWSSKPESSWAAKLGENESWTAKGNGGSWTGRNGKAWGSKAANDNVAKFNGESWPVKVKEETWKNGDTWPRKSAERNGWSSKSNELTPWQQKINDEWSYGKSSTGTWPAKWKQFAYHRVTAVPISKPGTTADASSAKSKNAFVAVSAVSSQKSLGNEWRKSEDENRNENGRTEEQDRSGNQVQVGLERPIYAWKKDTGSRTGSTKGNSTDPLENELEALRQIDFWSSYKENDAERRSTTTTPSPEKPSTMATNSTSTTSQRRAAASSVATSSTGQLEANRRTISMK